MAQEYHKQHALKHQFALKQTIYDYEIAVSIHYPECWDTEAYPTLKDALMEILAWNICSECGHDCRCGE